MDTYLARFNKMVDELRENPRLSVTVYSHFPPVTEERINSLENELGLVLHDSIKEFYRQTDGLQLFWMFHSNEQYEEVLQISDKEIDFYRQYEDYYPEDGAIMILPLEEVFLNTDVVQLYAKAKPHEAPVTFMGKDYDFATFGSHIRPFDCFSKFSDMAFFLDGAGNPPVIMGDDHHACYTDSLVTDFESYMEFVLANKGLVNRRKGFYGKNAGHQETPLCTPLSYWTKDKVLDLDIFLLKDIFPLSDQAGSSTAALNTPLMQQMALSSPPVKRTELRKIVEQHHQFLASGGAGGRWQTVHVSGLVLGIYMGSKHREGEQAAFDRKHLPPNLDMVGIPLPFANFCACHAKQVDFSEGDFSHSLFTDAMLEGAVFADANLTAADFSRANLQGASFMNTNLSGADFENCDLTNADFRGANMEGSRFPGAVLKGVKY